MHSLWTAVRDRGDAVTDAVRGTSLPQPCPEAYVAALAEGRSEQPALLPGFLLAAVLLGAVVVLVGRLLDRRRRHRVRRRAALLFGGAGELVDLGLKSPLPYGYRVGGRGRPRWAAAVLGHPVGTVAAPGAGPALPTAAAGRFRLPAVDRVRSWWARAGPGRTGASSAEQRAAAAQLPLTSELLAACMAAGAGPVEAARAVGGCLGGPLGERLVVSGEEVRLGAEPRDAWARISRLPGGGPLARCLERAQLSGAPAVEQMSRRAVEARALWARRATDRARRAGVLVTAPLGLCFLPAFLLVGVAPVVIGLGRALL